MIEVINLVKRFGPVLAVDDVSFDVKKGEVLGFLGPNGAGKSTTMRMITGYLPITGGTVKIDGNDVEDNPIKAKKLMGYLPEGANAYPEMTVESFLHFVAELHGFRGSDKKKAVNDVIERCFLEKVRSKNFDTLSKGYRHRTCFAQAILHDPPFLILDEPTDGLDPNQKFEIRRMIREMGKEKAIIVSTHILEEVDAICTRTIIIDRGKVVFDGSPKELREKSRYAGSVTIGVEGASDSELKELLLSGKGVASVEVLSTEKGTSVCCAYSQPNASLKSSEIADMAIKKGWKITELHSELGRLDEVFRSITMSDTEQEVK